MDEYMILFIPLYLGQHFLFYLCIMSILTLFSLKAQGECATSLKESLLLCKNTVSLFPLIISVASMGQVHVRPLTPRYVPVAPKGLLGSAHLFSRHRSKHATQLESGLCGTGMGVWNWPNNCIQTSHTHPGLLCI